MATKQHIDALTSLRFFAASMIVVHHSYGKFGFTTDSTPYFNLGQGVSFFFVLSGFILAYVYPRLETMVEIKYFWRARIARVYPVSLATFFLAYWLLALNFDIKTALANIFMVNAWVPFPKYFFSYNAPSWSISTELFFYLAFPFLIHRWEKTWQAKLIISGMIIASIIFISNYLQLPSYASLDDGITRYSLLHIHPVSRIFEFIFGVFIAFYWRKKIVSVQWSESRATLYEICAIIIAGASMHFVFYFVQWINLTWLGPAAAEWFSSSGSMFAFGLLIYVIAIGRGKITTYLSHPTLVLLGEISFSIYLLHQILLRAYDPYVTSLAHLPNALLLVIFWSVLLLSSYLMWALIEIPGRRFILGRDQGGIYGTKVMNESWCSNINWDRKKSWASSALICLVYFIYTSLINTHLISAASADRMTPKELQYLVGTRFGNLFVLRGVNVEHKHEGMLIKIAWESLADQPVKYLNGIHLLGDSSDILAQADYPQPVNVNIEQNGTLWKDSIFISKEKLNGKERRLAIVLYQKTGEILPINQGNRDWDNHRLLINF